MKKLTQEEFINKLPLDKNYEILEEYIKGEDKIKVKNKFGICLVVGESLIAGYKPTIETAIDKNEYFINQSKEIHGDKYDYKLINYIGNKNKIKIICRNHGIFEQQPNNHLNSQGCPICGLLKKNSSLKSSINVFKEKSNIIHNNKYDYSKSIYENARTKIIIVCPIHGEFLQTPFKHLNSYYGCKLCGQENNGWRKTLFIKRSRNFKSILYILKCFNDSEIFYKVGITNSSVKIRYSSKEKMPYQYEIIKEITKDSGEIWDLELLIKQTLKQFKYNPQIKFKGSATECFSNIKQIQNII